jgi:hypothetical protein
MIIKIAGEYAPEKQVIAGDTEQPMVIKSITAFTHPLRRCDSVLWR